jgi:tetratricopeptide (TPR) repeat protein
VTVLGVAALAVGAIVAIVLLLLNLLARLPWFKSHWPVVGIRRPTVSVEPLDDSALKDQKLGIAVAALMRERIEPNSSGSALKVVSGTANTEETWIERVSEIGEQGKVAAAVIGLLASLLPRRHVKVTGVLQPAAEPAGSGIGLELYRKLGSQGSVTFWAAQFQLPVTEDVGTARRLAVPAAAWVSHMVTTQTEGEAMGSSDPTSWALFRAAVERQEEGDSDPALHLYLEALAYDSRNYGALANLAGLEASFGLYEPAMGRYGKALEDLEAQVVGFTSNPDWYRIKYSLAAERVNWALADGGVRGVQLARAAAETWWLLNAVDRRLGRPKSWGLRAVQDDAGRALDAFLRWHLKPCLLVLLAAIELERSRSDGREPPADSESRAIGQLEGEIRKGEAVDPFLTVQAVEASYRELSPGLSYNLACFYAQAGDSPRAVAHLHEAVEGTPPSAWPRLRAEVERDPVLEPVRGALGDLFEDPLRHPDTQSAGRLFFWR